MKNLLDLQLWDSFKYAELSEVVTQIHKLFIYLLNINDDIKNILKARFVCESDKNYPKDALRTHESTE